MKMMAKDVQVGQKVSAKGLALEVTNRSRLPEGLVRLTEARKPGGPIRETTRSITCDPEHELEVGR